MAGLRGGAGKNGELLAMKKNVEGLVHPLHTNCLGSPQTAVAQPVLEVSGSRESLAFGFLF